MSDDEIAGHKTFHDGKGGFWHEPLTKGEANAIMERVKAADAYRKELMPDQWTAINLFFEAWQRLKELGWKDAIYCPKNGSQFEVIEAGSTGIHRCVYQGEWPDGHWWILEDDDMSPSWPVLFRPLPEPPK
jgi:hypothetical protein